MKGFKKGGGRNTQNFLFVRQERQLVLSPIAKRTQLHASDFGTECCGEIAELASEGEKLRECMVCGEGAFRVFEWLERGISKREKL